MYPAEDPETIERVARVDPCLVERAQRADGIKVIVAVGSRPKTVLDGDSNAQPSDV